MRPNRIAIALVACLLAAAPAGSAAEPSPSEAVRPVIERFSQALPRGDFATLHEAGQEPWT